MTTCVSPPELDEGQLAAFVAGEADLMTIEHLRRCAHCRTRAALAARIHRSLAQPLYRVRCPSPDTLREYHFGLLAEAEQERITDHLQQCARCTHELVQLRDFLEADEIPLSAPMASLERWQNQVKTILASLLPRSPSALPALAGLRGTAGTSQSLYQAAEWQIGLESSPEPQQPEARSVSGALWGPELEETDDLTSMWTAHLWREGHLVALAPVDDLGGFHFHGIAPATYEIILAAPNVKIQVAPVVVM